MGPTETNQQLRLELEQPQMFTLLTINPSVTTCIDLSSQCSQQQPHILTSVQSEAVVFDAATTVNLPCNGFRLKPKPMRTSKSDETPSETFITAIEPVQCPTCGLKLKHRKNLKSHMDIHVGVKKFQCPDCPKSFLRSNQLKSHSKVHTGDRPYTCHVCSRTFAQSSNFKVHMRLHDSVTPFNCQHCCKRYASQPELDEHHSYHVGPDQFRCTICGKTYTNIASLRYHRLAHSGERPFVCRACGKSFVHSSVLAVHMRTHTGAKPYKCAHCPKRFAQWTNFNRHQTMVHERKRDHRCAVCERRFVREGALRIHMDVMHAPEKTALVCGECGKEFKTQRRLDLHRAVHSGRCTVCNIEVGRDERAYRKHMRQHAWKHWCDICGYGFQSLRLIRMHMAAEHVRQPVYSCDVCAVELPDPQLEEHVREQHAGDAYQWHACPFCELRFAHREVLLLHLRDHQGMLQSEMQCSECGIVFQRFSYYKKHKCVRAKQTCNSIGGPETMRPDASSDSQPNKWLNSLPVATDSVADNSSLDTTEDTPSNEDEQISNNSPPLQSPQLPSDETSTSSPPIDEPQSCPICRKTFRCEKAVRMHMPVHGPKRFQCEFCAKRFVRMSQLETHRKTHTGDRPYQCEVCAKRFSQAGMVKVHMRTHTGQKPFQCGQCESSFAQAANLKRHEQTHSNLKPWLCRACGKGFQRKFTMQLHEKRHAQVTSGGSGKNVGVGKAVASQRKKTTAKPTTGFSPVGDKPFPCLVCRKTFATAAILQVHMRVHTGEKPYECRVCGKAFRQWTHLNRHRAVHTGEKPHGCGQCDRRFARLEALKLHERGHERDAERTVTDRGEMRQSVSTA